MNNFFSYFCADGRLCYISAGCSLALAWFDLKPQAWDQRDNEATGMGSARQ